MLKEPKIYFFDNGLVKGEAGAQFENLIAISLLKSIYAKNDYLAEPYELRYLRTKDGLEVDFALCKDEKIETIIEAKVSDSTASKTLEYFAQKYNIKGTQVVYNLDTERTSAKGIEIRKAKKYLENLE